MYRLRNKIKKWLTIDEIWEHLKRAFESQGATNMRLISRIEVLETRISNLEKNQ